MSLTAGSHVRWMDAEWVVAGIASIADSGSEDDELWTRLLLVPNGSHKTVWLNDVVVIDEDGGAPG